MTLGTILDQAYIHFDFANDNLDHSTLSGDFTSADFTRASLVGADLRQGEFSDADFTKANLREAQLPDTFEHQVKSLAGATMPNGKLHR